ncbi:neutral/alkaline non-lysosomal ceramidase N-terminal domain-containing protein [Paenibacillus sp. MBLB4367]|uniref:neutral/alkaline non-lysosomal ceramidase N-terminal domain-containing protein n=1 Tax=Paenibacillus sp. MBLB4367 TaxID=3384767 RepID=UPI00390803E9
MELLLGTAKRDITPEYPIALAGYSGRKGAMEGVNLPIFLRIALFGQESERGLHKQLVASADIIWWGNERMEPLRSKLAERFGLRKEDVILAASHSHSGPQTTAKLPLVGQMDENYVRSLEEKLYEGVEVAQANMEPVTAELGRGHCSVGVNRRKIVDGRALFEPNPAGPHDDEVTVVRFRKAGGEPKALFVHYTCHPTVTNANKLSAEFSGFAMAEIERQLGGDAVSLFLQGCCGDIRPALVRDGQFYAGNESDVKELGGRLAEAVGSVLAEPLHPLAARRLNGGHAACELPFQSVPPRERLEELVALDDKRVSDWAGQLLDDGALLREAVPLELVRLDIAEGLSLLSMNAEMVADYGLYVKVASAGAVLPVAYSNGMIGYVPTAEQLVEGGYEAIDSHYYFGLCSPFTASCEAIIKKTVDDMLAGSRSE